MTESMRPFFDWALANDMIGDVHAGAEVKPFPWDESCYQVTFYLDFADQSGNVGERDRVYVAAFVAPQRSSESYHRALAHGARNGEKADEVALLAAINFIGSLEVCCVYADLEMIELFCERSQKSDELFIASSIVTREIDLPSSTRKAREMLVNEIEGIHGFWRPSWRPAVADIAVQSHSWFF